jgi:hypothetical protein
MKNILFLLLFTGIILASNCSKEPEIVEAVLPDSVELGKSELYLNGLRDDSYATDFRINTSLQI